MKVLQGIVTSAKNAKTVTVEVTRKWQHPLYKKYVKRTKSYACHVEEMKLGEGDVVTIQECRPISKTKKFKVIAKVDKKVLKKITDDIVTPPAEKAKKEPEVKEMPAKKEVKETKTVKKVKKEKKA